jgi:hypothetical protein
MTQTRNAVLTVLAAPLVIYQQPQDASVVEGVTANFGVVASGSEPLTYQWYETSAGLLVGETSASLSIQTVIGDNGLSYYCIVTDSYATTIQSDTASLEVVNQAGTNRQDIRMKTPSGQWVNLFRGFTNWRGQWANGTYYVGDQVRDGAWLMIANKETTDRAGVQPSGSPISIFEELGGSFVIDSQTEDAYFTGNRFTFPDGGFLKAWRWYCPEASGDFEYSVWGVSDEAGSVQLLAGTTPSAVGWYEYPYNRFWSPGSTLDLIIVAKQINQTVTFSSDWVQQNKNGDPVSGEAVFQSNQTEIRISHLDNAAVDRQTDLEAVTEGATLEFGGYSWTVITKTNNTGFVTYTLAPQQGRPSAGLRTFTFTYGAATAIYFAEDAGLVAGDFRFEGIEGAVYDPSNPPTGNDNFYGVDLIMEEAVASDDWDFQAHTSFGAGSTTL